MPAAILPVSGYVCYVLQTFVMYVMMCACLGYCKQQWLHHGNEAVKFITPPG